MEATTSPSTKETANYARLCRLLVDVGSQVLRTTFDNIHPPKYLGTVLSCQSKYAILLALKKKKVLNPRQWEKLYPRQSPVSSQHFDITLLMILLRNVCDLDPPINGWDRPPSKENMTTAADIVRVTYYRDTVYSHARKAAVDDKTFNLYWTYTTAVLVRLGGTHYRNAIDSIKTENMNSHLAEKLFQECLKDWVKDESIIKEREGESEAFHDSARMKLSSNETNLLGALVTGIRRLTMKFLARSPSKSAERSTETINGNQEREPHLAEVERKINRIQPGKVLYENEQREGFAATPVVRLQGRSVCGNLTDDNVDLPGKIKVMQGYEKMQLHKVFPEKKINRLLSEDVYPAEENCKVIDKIILALERAINHYQSDKIADARNALRSLFVVLSNIQLHCLEVPNEDQWPWEVLARGKELFLESGVSCCIKHGTLLLDSSYDGQKYLKKSRSSPINPLSSPKNSKVLVEEFYSSVLNVLGAFALLISELEIARKTFELLVDLHLRLASSNSPLKDLGAAYNNKGCILLIMGDLRQSIEEFNKSLNYFKSEELRQLECLSMDTKSVAVYSNICRLHLISRNFNEALKLQEQLVDDYEAREINEIPFQTLFMMMNNRAVLYTSFGNFKKAEEALKYLKSYCNRIEREDCGRLLNFVRLHLCEVLLLQGKIREAEEEFSLEKLSSSSFTDLVDMFGGLYMNVRIEAFEKLVEVFVRRGKIQIAISLLEKTVEIIKMSFGSDHLNLASLLFKQGTILSLTGDLTSAAGKFKFSADILQIIFGQKNPLLVRCYMSLGDLESRLKHKEESLRYFQRAIESLEVLYHVSFLNELSATYLEIMEKPKKSPRSEVSKVMIEGLVAEHGQALAVLLQENNLHLRRSKTGKKPLISGERLGSECSGSKIMISQKYACDFLQTGKKLLRQGMKEEAAAFFEQAGAHCEEYHSKQGHSNAELVRMHSLLLKKYSGELTSDHDVNHTLEELSKEIQENEERNKGKQTTRDATTTEFDHQFNLKLFLIFLIMFSIELKEIDTTFAAYDLYTRLSSNENEFLFMLNDGIQVFASKALVHCNGETAFQDLLVSSTIGSEESIVECPPPDEQVFRSLSYKTNTSSNGFLATCRSPVILDIDDLLVLKRSVSLAVRECFQSKCFESENADGRTQVIVDLTSIAAYGHCSITSYGDRIELLPLCLTENFHAGIPQEQSIFEIQTSEWQDTKCMTFADEHTSSFMFKTLVLNLLQKCSSNKTLTLAVHSHSISLAIRQPVRALLTLSCDERSIVQRINFIGTTTTATILGITRCNARKYFQASCPKSVADVISWAAIDTSAKKYQVAYQSGIHLKDPLDNPVAQNKTVIPLKSSEKDSKSSLENSVLQCLVEVSEISRLLDEEPSPVRVDDNESLGPIGDDKGFIATESQSQIDQEYIPRKDDHVCLEGLNGEQTTFLEGQFNQDLISENSQQSEMKSEVGSRSQCSTLKAPSCAPIELNPLAHKKNSTQRAEDSNETWMENGDGGLINSNRPYASPMSSLKESQKADEGIVNYHGIPNFQHQPKEQNQSSKFYVERKWSFFQANDVATINEGAPKSETTRSQRNSVKSLVLEDTDVGDGPLRAFEFEREINNRQEWLGKYYLPSSSRAHKNTKRSPTSPVMTSVYHDASLRSRYQDDATFKNLRLSNVQAKGQSQKLTHALDTEPSSQEDNATTKSDGEAQETQLVGDRFSGADFFSNFQDPENSEEQSKLLGNGNTNSSERSLDDEYSIHSYDGFQDSDMNESTKTFRTKASEIQMTEESIGAFDFSKAIQENYMEADPESEDTQGAHQRHSSMKSPENFQAKLTQLSSFKEAKRAMITSLHEGERRHELEDTVRATKDGQGTLSDVMPIYGKSSFTSTYQGGDVTADGDSGKASPRGTKDDFDGPMITQEPIPNFSVRKAQGFSSKAPFGNTEYFSKEKANAPDSNIDHGGARPKRRLNDKGKDTNKLTMTNSRSVSHHHTRKFGLDPVFVARHINDANIPDSSTNAGNYDNAAVEIHQQDDHNQYFPSSKDHRSFSFGGKDASCIKGYFQSCHVSDEGRTSCPQRVVPQLLPLSQAERPSLPSQVCDEVFLLLPRRYCVDEGDPVIPDPKLFNNTYSRDSVNGVISRVNNYDNSTKNVHYEHTQISTSPEDEVSLTGNSSGSLLGSLEQVMAQTVQLIASSVTAVNEAQPILQSIEKVGVQENAREFTEQEVSTPTPINESSSQEDSMQLNESTLGADREPQSIATPVQESPRPVCSHYQRRCLVRFPCCGKFFPCHRCHNESDCSEDQARAINATHIRCTICYHEQVDAFSGWQILPCSHKVHKDCAIAMIQNGVRTCPICRHPLFGQLQTSPQ
ncbi:E3 ubiquitin-protein ligase DZIP3 [Stylophora pistillata]|uniref:E3 ubiquitin-protein ligase DZIP3 n=1 Tax=Stylophora pistillata TaxID=50429 RepID=A0A2B4RP41_STYPI|nr:E3 ubiquitin-protein ligase DZIP3 [Stylophora pistillata]